ncbi:DExH-box splicing factor binding site-domain-containing protein [Chlamydoabsidia padenii]|nr:DExH-box splicing factor binding site-domain-containing protein [Chlamydoabsidia padenii]
MSSNGSSSTQKSGFAMNLSGSNKKLPLGSKPRTSFIGNSTRVALADDDDDDDDDEDNYRGTRRQGGRIELVDGFENNKVTELNPKEEVKPLSIAPLANADWRALARQKKELYKPTRSQDPSLSSSSTAQNQEPEIIGQTTTAFGLQIPTRREPSIVEQSIETSTTITTQPSPNEPVVRSLEEQAIQAIIQESTEGDDDGQKGPVLVIPANETESFRNDIQTRPDDTTMEDYEKVPVEEFGAALLRGLGWNQGEGIGRNRKTTTPPVMAPVKQRDSLLGLGAKPQDVDKDNTDKKKKRRDRREGYEYKESSLFKKISKRRIDDDDSSSSSRSSHHYRSRRSRSRSRSPRRHSSSSSSRHSSSSRSRHKSSSYR